MGRDRFPGEEASDLVREARQVALDDDVVSPQRARTIPDEHRNRAWHLAVEEQLLRRSHERICDVGARQRHARNRRAHVEHGRLSNHELQRRGRRCRGWRRIVTESGNRRLGVRGHHRGRGGSRRTFTTPVMIPPPGCPAAPLGRAAGWFRFAV